MGTGRYYSTNASTRNRKKERKKETKKEVAVNTFPIGLLCLGISLYGNKRHTRPGT